MTTLTDEKPIAAAAMIARGAFLVRLERGGQQAVEQWRRAQEPARRQGPRR